MKRLVVIDTNILVSSLLSKNLDSATVGVVEKMKDELIVPLYNKDIIEEYEDVLNRFNFNFDGQLVKKMICTIVRNGIDVEPVETDELFTDLTDRIFYEVCLAKRDENSLLVTGNIKHFPKKVFVLTARELLEELEKDKHLS